MKNSLGLWRLRMAFMEMAERQIGEPYIWGRNGIIDAQDCSGLITLLMRSFRVLINDENFDTTAHGWINHFLGRGCEVETPYFGCLIAWDKPKAGHIGVCQSELATIEAGGGGSSTDYKNIPVYYWDIEYPSAKYPYANAIERWEAHCISNGAQVCVRALERPREVHAIVDPFKVLEAA
jgi:hypothetical protein